MSTEAKIPTPVEVIETMDMAANHGDLVNIVNLFTDDASINFQQPVPPFQTSYKGKEQILNYLKTLVTKDFHVESSNFRVAGNEVTWDSQISGEQIRKMGLDRAQITNHAVLWGALIQSITIMPSEQLLEKAQASMAVQGQR